MFGWKRAYDLPALTRRYYLFKWIGLVLCAWFAFGWLKTPVSEKSAPHFAKIHINMSPANNQAWLSALEQAAFDRNCRGILLVFDQAIGDGNAIGHTEQALQLVEHAKAYKPVVSYLYGYTLGSNYVLASAAHYVVAQETASIAGIGMRTAKFDYRKLMDQIGVRRENHGFGSLKTEPDPSDPNYQAFKAHREGITSQLQAWLLAVVAKNRKLSTREVQAIDNGQWYLGLRAKQHGLCDTLGDAIDATQWLQKKATLRVPMVRYQSTDAAANGPWGALLGQRVDWRAQLKTWMQKRMMRMLEWSLQPELGANALWM